MINTLEISKRLLNAKTDKEYAETIANVLQEREEFHFDKLSNKDDIANIRNDLNNLRTFMISGFTILGIIGAANLTLITFVVKISMGH